MLFQYKRSILFLFLTIWLSIYCFLPVNLNATTMLSLSVSSYLSKTLENEVLVTLFSPYITDVSHDFYKPYYTVPPSIFHYEIEVVGIERLPHSSYKITFGVNPFLGAHNYIGYDEVSFIVSLEGDITLHQFSHLQDEVVPEYLSYLKTSNKQPPLS